MDIEGTEFNVLPHMRSGGCCVRVSSTAYHHLHYITRGQIYHTFVLGSMLYTDYLVITGTLTSIEIRDSEDYLEDEKNPLQQTCPDYQP